MTAYLFSRISIVNSIHFFNSRVLESTITIQGFPKLLSFNKNIIYKIIMYYISILIKYFNNTCIIIDL